MAHTRKTLTLFDDYYDMMSDEIRMSAYSEAISQIVRPGDVVVDLGAGLGILSLLAIRQGAKRVYAIEHGDSIQLAQRIAKQNGYEDKIVFLNKNSKDCELPEKCDVLLSETLGSFALEENTLDFTIDARERFLKPNGRLLPHKLRTYLVPVQVEGKSKKTNFWKDVAGFDFGPARDEVASRMSLATIDPAGLLSEPRLFQEVDLKSETRPFAENRLHFQIARPGTIHGVAGWFEADLADGVLINTSPTAPSTHWQQAYFPFREAIQVIRGDILEVTLRVGSQSRVSDNTTVTYDYRCTQLAGDPSAAPA